MVSHVSFFSLENSLLCPCFGKFCRCAGCMGGVLAPRSPGPESGDGRQQSPGGCSKTQTPGISFRMAGAHGSGSRVRDPE